MPVYAIGDVQGCLQPLLSLLEQIGFHRDRDRVWFVGDLVNRGPHSLETLRYVKGLGEHAVTVLGNHDLHLLAVAEGVEPARSSDTLEAVLGAPDCGTLLAWLRTRRLVHRDPQLGFALVHAGLPPEWDGAAAERRGREVEAALRGSAYREFLAHMYGDEPERWAETLPGWKRLRFITNALTRLRYCREDGRLALGETGPPGEQPEGYVPWFALPGRRSRGERIVFGHWATLQLHEPLDPGYGVYHLDTGCVWGGRLTALRLDDRRWFSVPCEAAGGSG